tara:strand:- start:360 stop:938 length:579 start_codon:yes stop_codon:yes gene_type:complete
MFQVKNSRGKYIGYFAICFAFFSAYVYDFLDVKFGLLEDMNNELGTFFGTMLYWAFLAMNIFGIYFFGKNSLKSFYALSFEENVFKYDPGLKKGRKQISRSEIENIQLGYQETYGRKIHYLVFTPNDKKLVAQWNKSATLNTTWEWLNQLDSLAGCSWDINKRIGIPLRGLNMKNGEILEKAKNWLAESKEI